MAWTAFGRPWGRIGHGLDSTWAALGRRFRMKSIIISLKRQSVCGPHSLTEKAIAWQCRLGGAYSYENTLARCPNTFDPLLHRCNFGSSFGSKCRLLTASARWRGAGASSAQGAGKPPWTTSVALALGSRRRAASWSASRTAASSAAGLIALAVGRALCLAAAPALAGAPALVSLRLRLSQRLRRLLLLLLLLPPL